MCTSPRSLSFLSNQQNVGLPHSFYLLLHLALLSISLHPSLCVLANKHILQVDSLDCRLCMFLLETRFYITKINFPYLNLIRLNLKFIRINPFPFPLKPFLVSCLISTYPDVVTNLSHGRAQDRAANERTVWDFFQGTAISSPEDQRVPLDK